MNLIALLAACGVESLEDAGIIEGEVISVIDHVIEE